jgi:hypothetical protein
MKNEGRKADFIKIHYLCAFEDDAEQRLYDTDS